jgi:hypothetical protein
MSFYLSLYYFIFTPFLDFVLFALEVPASNICFYFLRTPAQNEVKGERSECEALKTLDE